MLAAHDVITNTGPDGAEPSATTIRGPAPSFQCYPNDFLADADFISGKLEEFGAFLRVFLSLWHTKSLPLDMKFLARLLGVTPRKAAKLWAVIGHKFDVSDGRITHRLLEIERAKQAAHRETNRQNANKRWKNERAE